MRPRLGEHVRARRHVVDGSSFVILSDDARGLTLKLGEREWALVRAMDGTRDLEGVRAAAGVKTSNAELAAFARQLEGLGLFEAPPGPRLENAFARDVPLSLLEGARFACDGSGRCCASFDSVLFTPLDQARARAAAPEVLDGGQDGARAFLPAQGVDPTVGAVTAIHGACAYLDPDGRCRIHSVRPHGCRTFPWSYLDVGDAIRVSLRPECLCVFRDGGDLPELPARGGGLPRELHVPRLPDRVTLGDREADVADWLALIDELSGRGPLDLLEAAAELGPWAGLHERLERARAEVARLRERQAYRAGDDPTRRGLDAVGRALEREEEHLDAAAERRFLRAKLFVLEPIPSPAEAIRRVALAVLVARRFGPEERAWAEQPLAVVAALMRGAGLTLGA